jgi:hypothetical protein
MIDTSEATLHSYDLASSPSFITTVCATKNEGEKGRFLCASTIEYLTCDRRSVMFIETKSMSRRQRISENPKCCVVPNQN